MTVTEVKPEETVAIAAVESPQLLEPPSGVAGIVGSADHKVVGRLYVGVSLLFLAASLAVSAVVASEGADASGLQLLDRDSWFQMLTLSQVGIVFGGLIPAFLGLGMYVVPLQVGARAIAFPRLAAASFWGWLVGMALIVVAYSVNGGPGGGDLEGVLLFYSALGLVMLSLAAACICIITTVGMLRTPGMTLLRTPAFSWSMLVAGSVWLLSMPVLGANVLLAYLDTNYGQLSFGSPQVSWAQLSWFFQQPAALAVAIPVLGVAADAVPVLGRHRIASRGAVTATIGAYGILTFGPWAQTAFNPRLVQQATFIGFSVLVGLPVLALLGALMDTLRRGKPSASSALPLSLLGVLATLAAGAAAGAVAVDPLNLWGTTWSGGVAKLAGGAAVAGIVAALQFWGPKMFNAQPSEALGKLNVLVVAGGVALFGGGDLLAGGLGQLPADFAGGYGEIVDGAEIGFVLSAVGAVLLTVSVVLTLLALLGAALGKGRTSVADPWGGHTLEWTTASPPPYENFMSDLAPVTSATPLLDVREQGSQEVSA